MDGCSEWGVGTAASQPEGPGFDFWVAMSAVFSIYSGFLQSKGDNGWIFLIVHGCIFHLWLLLPSVNHSYNQIILSFQCHDICTFEINMLIELVLHVIFTKYNYLSLQKLCGSVGSTFESQLGGHKFKLQA